MWIFFTTINKPKNPTKKENKSSVKTVFLLPIIENISLGFSKACKLSKSEKSQKRTVSLPMNERLSFNQLEYVIDKVKENI